MSDPGYYNAVATNQRGYGVSAIIAMSDALRLAQEEVDTLRARLAEAERENAALREAAQAVVDRWDTPLWKDAEPTAGVINRLRALLERKP